MSDLPLSKDELALLHRLASERTSAFYRHGFDAATVLPVLAFAIFGFVKRDLVALGLAFFGLLALYLWRISAESGMTPIYRSISQKVLQHQQPSSGGSADDSSAGGA